ncbi:hypothetical protein GCM10007923_30630 [Shinella yambaruensis]|uniref:Uncharacterized protein n=1 Tax=Shinella yambaruensis TaxID=415996 RepID=A0ABQ5ZGD4_9HYPH|nr:hypothetical protein GCM10007923_30630 [Shinella yambaruensis]
MVRLYFAATCFLLGWATSVTSEAVSTRSPVRAAGKAFADETGMIAVAATVAASKIDAYFRMV